ncbi:MAG: hypothetical protein ACOC5D_07415 [Thermoplasmatota archaeon]
MRCPDCNKENTIKAGKRESKSGKIQRYQGLHPFILEQSSADTTAKAVRPTSPKRRGLTHSILSK